MSLFQHDASAEPPIAVEEAQQRVLDQVRTIGTERIAFNDALGRVLRQDVRAPRDLPPADNSAMDGYAVRAEDIEEASTDRSVELEVIADLPAGTVATSKVARGTAIRIMTGAPLPEGADTVVPVELTDAGSKRVRIDQKLPTGANVRSRGEDMKAGDVVLSAGTRIGPGELGVLASTKTMVVTVARRPTVAIISTGDEIVEVDQSPGPGQVLNSNAWALSSLVSRSGGIPRLIGVVEDTREATIAAIDSALESDLVISSGGVSVGAYDYVRESLAALGAETRFWRVAMKPGKPVVFATLRSRLFFGLPGNPVSCMVSFLLFVAPAIRRATGLSGSPHAPLLNMRIDGTMRSAGDRRTYHRVRIVARDGELVALPMKSQGSGVSTSMLGANGLAVLEVGTTGVESGMMLPVLLIGEIEAD